ncbi:MAG: HIT family protein [Bacilli bacterium]|jgi:histidine triad (HIT) family protein
MCVFCKIVKGEIPSYKVYEDENYLAFLDISQATLGHTLVIPKAHYENFLDLKNPGKIFELTQKITTKISKTLNVSDFNILNNTGIKAGQTVNHFHLHIIPRYKENDLLLEFKKNSLTKEDFTNLLNKITAPF